MRMTGGEALAKQLQREGVRVVFGLPGVQLYGAMAALRDEKDIRFILTRHEQATTYMADGYARAGGGVGVALVVPGPGVLNAGAGLSTAYSCSSPVFLVAGQVPRRYLGKDVGVLHEINEQLDVVKPVTKWRKRVLEVARDPGRRPGGVPPAQDRPSATGAPGDPARHPGGRGRGRAVAGGHGGAHRGARRRHRAGRARAARRHAPDHLRRRRRARLRRPRGADRGGRVPPGRRRAVRRGQGLGERPERSRARRGALAQEPAARVPRRRRHDLRRRLAVRGGRLPAHPEDRPARRGRRGDRPQSSGGRRPGGRRPPHPRAPAGAAAHRRAAQALAQARARAAARGGLPGWTRRSRITRSWPRCARARPKTPSSSPA